MGVYIKGMEMPQKIEPGLVVEFAVGIDGKRYARLHHYLYGGLTDWLEAVPVPPHGDLIDRDALKIPYDICDGNEAMEFVNEAKVVIPAEEGI